MTDFTKRIPRWTSRIKTEFLQLIRGLSARKKRALMEFHNISDDELASWVRLNQLAGPSALRTTRLHKHRPVIYTKPRRSYLRDDR